MKKLLYLTSSVLLMVFMACGGGNDHEASEENAESHEGHDHEAMVEEAKSMKMVAAPEGARVFFVNLKEGQMAPNPLKVVMGVEGMTVHPAGELLEGTGHHHLIIDAPAVPFGEAVPADENHIHFGGGQTETEVQLMPGPHTITLQFADGMHRSYGEEVSTTIMVEIEETR